MNQELFLQIKIEFKKHITIRGLDKMSWKSEVQFIIKKICPIGEKFNLYDVYKYRELLQNLYPNNNHIEDKIRQTLQYLRDDGIIEFTNNYGEYQRIK